MGYRGPIPKPTAVEIAEGRPGKRPINNREPKPLAKAPKCPAHLDERAKQEWRRLLPILRRMKVLTEADGLMLANLCLTVSRLVTAQEKLNELGILYKAPSGYVMQSPLLGIINNCVETITRISREFGLTPAARSRIIAQVDEGESVEDELARILWKPRVRGGNESNK